MYEDGLCCKRITPAEVLLCLTCRQTFQQTPAVNMAPMAPYIAEELGLVLEVAPEDVADVQSAYEAQGLSAAAIGSTSADKGISISVGGEASIQGGTAATWVSLLMAVRPLWWREHQEHPT